MEVDMHTTLGRSGLETLDTLIMAGIAETRADAIRWALARIRERPAYERLRERIQEIDQLRTDF
jgi:Arc/MetJ-type ribon-helix-helix transcriptional regulator